MKKVLKVSQAFTVTLALFLFSACDLSTTSFFSSGAGGSVNWFPTGNSPGGNAMDEESGLGWQCNTTIHQEAISDTLIQEVNNSFPEGVVAAPELLDYDVNPNLHLTKETDITVTFIAENAIHKNDLGYFIYEDANEDGEITQDEVLGNCRIFKNASGGGEDGLNTGDSVTIGTFPAGTKIGFYIISNAQGGDINGTYYTYDHLNADGARHLAMLLTSDEKHIILGFEETLNLGDSDYNDVLFTVNSSVPDAIEGIADEGDIPNVDDDGNIVPDDDSDDGSSGTDGSDSSEEPVSDAIAMVGYSFSYDETNSIINFSAEFNRDDTIITATIFRNGTYLRTDSATGSILESSVTDVALFEYFQIDIEAEASDGTTYSDSFVFIIEGTDTGTGTGSDDGVEGEY